MSQPLLALCALLLLSTFALSQHRSNSQLQSASHARDAERVLLEYTSELMSRIEAPGIMFDRGFATLDDPFAIRDPALVLTPPGLLGLNPDIVPENPATYQTVDDFINFPADQVIDWDGGEVPVSVEVDVQYVHIEPLVGENPIPSDVPTFTKLVTVSVVEQVAPNARRPAAQITVNRLITPARLALH